jgi:hypothetical protein
MPLNNNIGTHRNEFDTFQSKSRFLVAQNRCRQQRRQSSMLHRLASEVGVTVEFLKAE